MAIVLRSPFFLVHPVCSGICIGLESVFSLPAWFYSRGCREKWRTLHQCSHTWHMMTCTQQHDYVGVLLSGGPAGVVQEVVLGQHLEHVVSATLQEGGPGALDLAGRDVAELEVTVLPPRPGHS